MKIILNGEDIDISSGFSVSDLINSFSLDVRKIAVEKNLEIVSRSKFSDEILQENDIIEIIHFIGGG
ncbi:MAG: sulfur carrier protein ThiS [Rickettsiales bacterium]|nr:sulfur carrier protein ThiS [Rickettsiales bacterium]